YFQDVTDLNFTRALPDVLSGANLASGAEYRYESYAIGSGDPASFQGAGASGFPGFNPRIPVNNSRSAYAAYIDGELKPLAWLSVNAAGRYDHYQDFGGAATWKASARAEATSWLAVRASASTGFRAPSLQQEYYSSITTVANGANKSLVNVGTYQVGDPIARALGATPLRPEKSHDKSAGIVVKPTASLSMTADVFRTDIDNRIALSDALSGAAVTSVLTAAGITNVQQAAFFTNALSTRTQGYDLTTRYLAAFTESTRGSLALAFEHSPTEILSLTGNPVLPSLPPIGLHARTLLTQAQPKDKLTAQVALDHGPFSSAIDVTRYGEYVDAPILDPQTFGARTIVDLSFGARLGQQLTVTAGVLNVGNTYPEQLAEQALAYKSFGGSFLYGEESPFGTDGRAYYVRLQLQL
ncbi:MAG TPA: TonB-dependent receptor, partial [Steroidobacteraceae bacterium]